jgi:hypothetical protein
LACLPAGRRRGVEKMEKKKYVEIYFMEATGEQGVKLVEDYGDCDDINGLVHIYDASGDLRFIVNKDSLVCLDILERDD